MPTQVKEGGILENSYHRIHFRLKKIHFFYLIAAINNKVKYTLKKHRVTSQVKTIFI